MAEQPTPTSPSAPSEYTGAAELAKRLGISRQTLYAHARASEAAAAAGQPFWLPAPKMVLGRLAWLTAELEDIELVDRPRPGNPNWRRTGRPDGGPAHPTI